MSSEQSFKALEEINIFYKENKQLRNCFLFFFLVAVCGYLAIMISLSPHGDDYFRYIGNEPVGLAKDARYFSIIIQNILYFSDVITDISPCSHLISCALLAYVAIVFIRILRINTNDKYGVLCLATIVVNPYLLECMVYRFDNPFMMLAILFTTLSAYLSSRNEKRLIFMQTALLLLGLFIYQPASSSYFIIFLYLLLTNMTSDKSLVSIMVSMRYLIYTPIITFLCYLHFIYKIEYCRETSGNLLLVPTNLENIKRICSNIFIYINHLKADWMCNISGIIFLFLFIAFSVFLMIDCFKNIQNKFTASYRCILVAICSFLFFISPLGPSSLLCTFTSPSNSSECVDFMPPRILCCFGLLISIVLYQNYQSIKKYKFVNTLYVIYLICFVTWNVIFMNSSGNVIYHYAQLRDRVYYDLAKDVAKILETNNKFIYFRIQGSVSSQAMVNFSELYPIIARTVPEKSNAYNYCIAALLSYQISDFIFKDERSIRHFDETEHLSKKLLKHHLWYDIYSLDGKVLLFQLKRHTKLQQKLQLKINNP